MTPSLASIPGNKPGEARPLPEPCSCSAPYREGGIYHEGSKHHRMARQPTRRTRAPRKGHRLPGANSKRTGLGTLGLSEQHWLHFPRHSASGRPHVSRARWHTLIHSRAPARHCKERARLRSSRARRSPSPGSASEPPAPAPEPWYDLCPHTGAPATAVMAALEAANPHQEEKLLEKQEVLGQPATRSWHGGFPSGNLKIPPALDATQALPVFWPSDPRPRSEAWPRAPIQFCPASAHTPHLPAEIMCQLWGRLRRRTFTEGGNARQPARGPGRRLWGGPLTAESQTQT